MSDLDTIKRSIWTHKKVNRSIINLQVEADGAQVRLPITQLHEAQKLLDFINKPRRVKRTVITPAWCIDRYAKAHQSWWQKEYPNAYKDGHYHGMEPVIPDLATTNGITSFVSNYVKWSGGYANRINVQGRKINGKWIPSSTKKGTEDLDLTWSGRKIACEIKNAFTKDTIKPNQEKQQGRIERAGGIYIVVTGVENFFEQWDKIVAGIPVQSSIFDAVNSPHI